MDTDGIVWILGSIRSWKRERRATNVESPSTDLRQVPNTDCPCSQRPDGGQPWRRPGGGYRLARRLSWPASRHGGTVIGGRRPWELRPLFSSPRAKLDRKTQGQKVADRRHVSAALARGVWPRALAPAAPGPGGHAPHVSSPYPARPHPLSLLPHPPSHILNLSPSPPSLIPIAGVGFTPSAAHLAVRSFRLCCDLGDRVCLLEQKKKSLRPTLIPSLS